MHGNLSECIDWSELFIFPLFPLQSPCHQSPDMVSKVTVSPFFNARSSGLFASELYNANAFGPCGFQWSPLHDTSTGDWGIFFWRQHRRTILRQIKHLQVLEVLAGIYHSRDAQQVLPLPGLPLNVAGYAGDSMDMIWVKCLLKETKFNRISPVMCPLNEKSIQRTRWRWRIRWMKKSIQRTRR